MIRYDLSATEILKRLGYDKPVGKERLQQWMQEKGTTFPKIYCEFMEVAMDCPMLETADLWTGQMGEFLMKPWFLYEEIEEQIEDQKKDWEEDEESREENAYYPFSQLPKEQWGEKVADFLEIGSDYGAGVVSFGICREDLGKEDPPVYMNHEADEITDWNQMYPTLSDYLLEVVLNVLICQDYSTAMEALEDQRFHYLDYEDYEYMSKEEELLEEEAWQAQVWEKSGIDLKRVSKRMSNRGDGELFCCYEEEKEILYVGKLTEDKISWVMILKEGQTN